MNIAAQSPSSGPGYQPLPPGWTEHKAPTGHTYYYNKETRVSTYTRPVIQPQLSSPLVDAAPIPSYGAGQFAGGFSNAQFQSPNFTSGTPGAQFQPNNDRNFNNRGGYGGRGRVGNNFQDKRRPDDRPKHKYKIPGCEPWVLVKTKMGRRFVHNIETKESLWKFPEDVMKGVVEFDRIEREKQERRDRGEPSDVEDEEVIAAEETAGAGRASVIPVQEEAEDSSEYEEIEVTDSEDETDGPSKRQRTEEAAQDEPVEFNEDDIAFQLASMGADYGLDPGEYGVEGAEVDEEWEEGAEGIPLTLEDSKSLFRELLDDYHINPYNPWNKIIEDGAIIDDSRYLALPNMRSRKDCFDEWSRQRIQDLKEQKEKMVKADPRIPYFAFLEEHASTKLYWPEFKRKFRKEAVMKEQKVPDKDKEKWYREHIKRLLLPSDTLKKDLSTLLKSLPLSALNRSTSLEALPAALLTDLRYISLPAKTRDPMISAFISTLPPPPSDGLTAKEEEAEQARKRDRERREKALEEREKRVQEEKRRQRKDLAFGRERLREGEVEVERAMRVGNKGLRAQLDVADDEMIDKDLEEYAN